MNDKEQMQVADFVVSVLGRLMREVESRRTLNNQPGVDAVAQSIHAVIHEIVEEQRKSQ